MKILNKFKNIINSFEDLILKNHSCISCGNEIIDGTKYSICEKCIKNINKLSGNICNKCSSVISNKFNVCYHCKNTKYMFDKNISFYKYNDEIASIVKQLKYSSKKYYAKYIAEMMTEDFNYFKDIDYITYVPISSNRKIIRGYNQAEEIAKEISKIENIPVIDLLYKDNGGKNQAELSKEERLTNLKNCFHLTNESVKVRDKNIIIIDDVFTTGTTLNRCCEEIKKAKPKNLISMTFTKTSFEDTNL